MLEFPDGLIGLAGTRYALLGDEDSPFFWLHSVDDPTLAVPVTNPWLFFDSYEVESPTRTPSASASTDARRRDGLRTVRAARARRGLHRQPARARRAHTAAWPPDHQRSARIRCPRASLRRRRAGDVQRPAPSVPVARTGRAKEEPMLVITRKAGERLLIGDDITVTLMEINGSSRPPRHRRAEVRRPCTARRSGRRSRKRTAPPPTARPDELPKVDPDASQARAQRRQSQSTALVSRTRLITFPRQCEQDQGMVTTCHFASNNIEAFNAHRQLSHDRATRSRSRWSASPPASASTAPPTTQPASRSRRSCAPRSRGLAQAQRNAQDARLAGADRGRRARTRCTRCSTASASSPCSTRTARSRPPTRPRSRPRSTSSAPRSRGSAPTAKFNGITLLPHARPITFQVGAERRPDDHRSPRSPCGASARHRSTRRSSPPSRPTSPRSTPRSRPSPRTRATFGAVQNRLEHTLNNLAPTRRT